MNSRDYLFHAHGSINISLLIHEDNINFQELTNNIRFIIFNMNLGENIIVRDQLNKYLEKIK